MVADELDDMVTRSPPARFRSDEASTVFRDVPSRRVALPGTEASLTKNEPHDRAEPITGGDAMSVAMLPQRAEHHRILRMVFFIRLLLVVLNRRIVSRRICFSPM